MLWAVLVWQESSLSYHRNLTVKRVMPLRDYKAQYSVIIYRYISFVLKKSFCNELELDKLSRTVVSNAVAFPRVPPKNSFFPFILFCTKNTSLKKKKWLAEYTKQKWSLPWGYDLVVLPPPTKKHPSSSSFWRKYRIRSVLHLITRIAGQPV